MPASVPLPTLLSQALIAFTIELDNELERRFADAGGGARVTSVVMWSNLLRFVGDGITVDGLVDAARLPRARTLSTLGAVERWRYVAVGPATAERRDGYGSARGLRGDLLVRPTPAGRVAATIWPELFADVEERWAKRFGTAAVEKLRKSLAAVVGRIDVELPEYVPIVDGRDGMAARLLPLEPGAEPPPTDGPLTALLSAALLAYTIDFERESELSLPLSENVVRVLDETGTVLGELPLAAGVSKEATSMALTYLSKNGYVEVESKVVRLTRKGSRARTGSARLRAEVEHRFEAAFGEYDVHRLLASLERVLEDPRLPEGLRPPPGAWRGTKRYLAHTEAMLADPGRGLPRYPMVLHRGGWPDGS